MPLSPLLRPVAFDQIPGWSHDEGMATAHGAFARSAVRFLEKPYRTGALGIEASAFAGAFKAARATPLSAADDVRRFFEAFFRPCRITPDDRPRGFVTGFYEPQMQASEVLTERFRFPLYRRPDDLVDVGEDNRPADMDPYFAFGRLSDGGIVEYFDRAEIEGGALAGRGLEMAWLADPVDVFFIHVQGAARLIMPDGSARRVTYAAKSGHRFTGPGGILAELGEIPLESVTMQKIRGFFRENPARISEILHQNRSFIFFREAPVDDLSLGPVAAAKVPLTAGRSIAVDRLLHTFGTPIFVHAPDLDAFGARPFARLMIAQDTGSAITGSARGDLFAGSGDAAGEIAGVIRHDADFFALVPRPLLEANP
ncbi:murein transglycosylase A [Nitratireductor mangrovi]|uniref:murein transglycosylase A n=1 Tax=Nitratireductor mangrovi TaxID=2599600 RepID=UPI001FEFCADE|nr:murein transglycosylase A [Nitratireductor mangrovi]